jgi:hypothetical protein
MLQCSPAFPHNHGTPILPMASSEATTMTPSNSILNRFIVITVKEKSQKGTLLKNSNFTLLENGGPN